jgi:cyclopropane fatty-acyl-phospholipid synthase-like methyltransferase
MEGFSQAADNNKTPILNTFSEWLSNNELVLEIGSGSGQHAIHIAKALQKIRWQPTEHPSALQSLINNISSFGGPNILAPESLDLAAVEWPTESVDCVYSANVIHIIDETLGRRLIETAAESLKAGGLFALYGPFKYQGDFTTTSNAEFDDWLKDRNSSSGIRDFEWVMRLAQDSGLTFMEDRSMPANNQFLAFRRL